MGLAICRGIVAALEGSPRADDYMTKPFGMAARLARIRVALRHRAQALGGEPQ
jgi:two-component system, OmpR family, KDP operon response regulator KdpE